ncbi:hypothetical protein GILI108418_09805 [Gillisia limnaea]|jgi:succinylglutamate desuccinylase
MVGVAGNKMALENNERFIEEDLGRTWKEDSLQ